MKIVKASELKVGDTIIVESSRGKLGMKVEYVFAHENFVECRVVVSCDVAIAGAGLLKEIELRYDDILTFRSEASVRLLEDCTYIDNEGLLQDCRVLKAEETV